MTVSYDQLLGAWLSGWESGLFFFAGESSAVCLGSYLSLLLFLATSVPPCAVVLSCKAI